MANGREGDAAGPLIDVWANSWDAAFFAAEPQLRGLYQRLGLEG